MTYRFPGTKVEPVHNLQRGAAHTGLDTYGIVPQRYGEHVAGLPLQAQEGYRSRKVVRENQAVVYRPLAELPYLKQDEFFKKSLMKDWRNGMKHSVPISATFNVFNYINTPSLSLTDRMYTNRVDRAWDAERYRANGYHLQLLQRVGLQRFGVDGYKGIRLLPAARLPWQENQDDSLCPHPSVSFNGAPDFGLQVLRILRLVHLHRHPRPGTRKEIQLLPPTPCSACPAGPQRLALILTRQ